MGDLGGGDYVCSPPSPTRTAHACPHTLTARTRSPPSPPPPSPPPSPPLRDVCVCKFSVCSAEKVCYLPAEGSFDWVEVESAEADRVYQMYEVRSAVSPRCTLGNRASWDEVWGLETHCAGDVSWGMGNALLGM